MLTPWTALYAPSSGSSSPYRGAVQNFVQASSSPYRGPLSEFMVTTSKTVRKPYKSPATHEQARELAARMLEISPVSQNQVQLQTEGGFLLIVITGMEEWVNAAAALAKSEGWKKHRDIMINETVYVKPYTLGSEVTVTAGPVLGMTHSPRTHGRSWANLGTPPASYGEVTYSAAVTGRPVPTVARELSEFKSAKGRGSVYDEAAAHKAAVNLVVERKLNASPLPAPPPSPRTPSPRSNVVAGGYRKTRRLRR